MSIEVVINVIKISPKPHLLPLHHQLVEIFETAMELFGGGALQEGAHCSGALRFSSPARLLDSPHPYQPPLCGWKCSQPASCFDCHTFLWRRTVSPLGLQVGISHSRQSCCLLGCLIIMEEMKETTGSRNCNYLCWCCDANCNYLWWGCDGNCNYLWWGYDGLRWSFRAASKSQCYGDKSLNFIHKGR